MSIEAFVRALYWWPPKGGRNVSAVDALRVWQSYAEQAEPDGRPPYPAMSGHRMALELKMTRRTFRNALVALVAQGYLRKTGDAIPRVTGDQYQVLYPPLTRAGKSTELGRGNQPDSGGEINPLKSSDLGGEINPTRAGDSGGESPPHPYPLPVLTSENNCKSARETISAEELAAISNPATREIVAQMIAVTAQRDADIALAARYAT